MNLKTLHKAFGITLFIPVCLWALTGVVFLIKPGYSAAFERLSPKFSPISGTFIIPPGQNWHEIKIVKTILGNHLIVNDQGAWKNLDPTSLQVRPLPSSAELIQLVDDAIAKDRKRYGHIVNIQAEKVLTDTGVTIQIDWSQLSLEQTGQDSRLINALYKIHYLQWLGVPVLNNLLGALGITAILLLALLGLVANFKSRKTNKTY